MVVKKTSGIQTFFSTTVHSLMPLFRISVHYYGKRYKIPDLQTPSSKKRKWQARRDSNPQHPDLESDALPLELLACILKLPKSGHQKVLWIDVS